MMTSRLHPCVAALYLMVAHSSSAGISSTPLREQNLPDTWAGTLTERIMQRHIEGVGLVIYGCRDEHGQARFVGRPRGLTEDHDKTLLVTRLTDPVLDLAQPRPGRLEDCTLDSNAFILRVQNNLDVDEAKVQSATFSWVDDAAMGEFWNVDAAVILDVYLMKNPLHLLEYNARGNAVHLRTGFSWDRVTAGGEGAETDVREAFFGLSFYAQDERKESIKGLQQSPMQIGVAYREDAIARTSQWSVDFNYQPRLFSWLGYDIPFLAKDRKAVAAASDAKEPMPLTPAGTSNREGSNDPRDPARMLGNVPAYFYIRPNFTLSSVLDDLRDDGNADLADYQVTWGGRCGVSFCNDCVQLSYRIVGVSPVERMGDPFVFHEARAELQPTRRQPFRFVASYTNGERAPAFQREDRFMLSVGLRF